MLLASESHIFEPLIIIRATDASLSQRINYVSHIDKEGDDSSHWVSLEFRKLDLTACCSFIEGFLNLGDPELKTHVKAFEWFLLKSFNGLSLGGSNDWVINVKSKHIRSKAIALDLEIYLIFRELVFILVIVASVGSILSHV